MTPSFRPGDRVRLTGTVTEHQAGLPPDIVAVAVDGRALTARWGTEGLELLHRPAPALTPADAQVGDRVKDGDGDWATVLCVAPCDGRSAKLFVRYDEARYGVHATDADFFEEIRRPVVDHAESIFEALDGCAEPGPTAPPTDPELAVARDRLERETRTVALTWAVNARSHGDEPLSATMNRAGAFLAFLRRAR